MTEICGRRMVEPRGIEPLTSTMPLYHLRSESAEMRRQERDGWRNRVRTGAVIGTNRTHDGTATKFGPQTLVEQREALTTTKDEFAMAKRPIPIDIEELKKDPFGHWIAYMSGGNVPPPSVDPFNRIVGESRPAPKPQVVTTYFIGPEDGPIKIGRASRLDFRLRDLQLMNPHPLHVWATVSGSAKIEREYHRQFSVHRLHGEWFSRHPDILAEIDRLSTPSIIRGE